MSDDLVKRLREDQPVTQDMVSTMQCALQDAAADRIEALEAENARLLQEADLQAAEIDKTRRRADKWQSMVLDCEKYLKPGETPRERMDRDHNDTLSLMSSLAKEKRKTDRLRQEADVLVAAAYEDAAGIGVDYVNQDLPFPDKGVWWHKGKGGRQMSQDLIDHVKAALEGATPGPWRVVIDDDGNPLSGRPGVFASEEQDCGIVHWDGFVQQFWRSAHGDKQIQSNAALIALAPDMARALLAMEAERKAAEELASAIDRRNGLAVQDMGDQMQVDEAVDAALAAYRKAREAAE